MHFGENQLSRSLIGLSPLPTTHPLSLQPKWVRASTRSYPRFTLAMGRSLRFGSRTCHSSALFRLAFAAATPHGLTLRHVPDSQAHSSKGTPSPHKEALTDCRHTVSGTISLPSRGTFHLSLTVLVHYRSLNVFSLGEWSPQLPTRFHVPRGTQDPDPEPSNDLYRTLTCSGCAFQHIQVVDPFVLWVLQPHPVLRQHGLGSSRLARHYCGNLMLISFRRATEMFQFTHCPPPHLCVR